MIHISKSPFFWWKSLEVVLKSDVDCQLELITIYDIHSYIAYTTRPWAKKHVFRYSLFGLILKAIKIEPNLVV
jgi:hypothetical protein